jgi:hypothetical protein
MDSSLTRRRDRWIGKTRSAGRYFQRKQSNFRLLEIVYFLAVLTSSFDIFLAVDIGVTIRIAQLLLVPPILIGFTSSLFSFPKELGRCVLALAAWIAIQIVALCLHGFTPRGMGYTLWMVFYAALLVATPSVFRSKQRIEALLRGYIWSFTILSLFGILQFVAGLLGIQTALIQQWWVEGKLARVNGFSYEPSYFATYLMLGWVTLAALTANRKSLSVQRIIKSPNVHLIIITAALLLSSSRMGIMAMLGWSIWVCLSAVFQRTEKLSITRGVFAMVPLCAIAGLTIFWPALGGSTEDRSLFLDGTGLAGTASHSVDQRSDKMQETLDVFLSNPIIGVGVGGVAEEVARNLGRDPFNREDLKISEGMCVTLEILAGTGIGGLVLAGSFFFQTYKLKDIGKKTGSASLNFLGPLASALVVELLLLQLNQNILRQYLWQHIAIMFAVAACPHGDNVSASR